MARILLMTAAWSLAAISQGALISATPEAGMLRVVIDICPDTIAWATTAPGQPVVTILEDQFWTSTESLWLFHINGTGSLHHFNLDASYVGLYPELYPLSDETRVYGYSEVDQVNLRRVDSFAVLPVTPMSEIVTVPEPSAAVVGMMAAAMLIRRYNSA